MSWNEDGNVCGFALFSDRSCVVFLRKKWLALKDCSLTNWKRCNIFASNIFRCTAGPFTNVHVTEFSLGFKWRQEKTATKTFVKNSIVYWQDSKTVFAARRACIMQHITCNAVHAAVTGPSLRNLARLGVESYECGGKVIQRCSYIA